MIVFPNCKINLGLNVLERRSDGYHNIETVFFPVAWNDALEVVPSLEPTALHASGYPSGPDAENLVLRAYDILKKDYPKIAEVQIYLHKAIPAGAGLGGGSSDGAFALQMFCEKFNIHISQSKLKDYALQLGSDCPFFLTNRVSLATGRGERLEEIPLSLSGYRIYLIFPEIHISTREAFLGLEPSVPQKSLSEIIRKPVSQWKESLHNDFEKSVFPRYPLLKRLKEEFYDQGALYASMSGSGSTVFGIFDPNRLFSFPETSYPHKEVLVP